MILDLIIIGITVLLVIIGFVRGIAKTLLNLLSVIASAVCAYLGAGLLSNLVYSFFISPTVTNSITDSLADSTTSAATIVNEAFDRLPDFLTGIFKMFGIAVEELSKSAVETVGNSKTDIAGAVDIALKPVVTSVLSVIFVIVLFILFLIIFKYIAKKFERIFHIPIVGMINKILGGILGLCEAAVICFVGIMVIKIMFVFSQDPFITQEMISESAIFSAVYYSDFLNTVAGFLGFGKEIAATASKTVAQGASQVESAVR